MTPPLSFGHLVYALRCAPSIGGAPCMLIRDWAFKRDLLGLQLTDLPRLSDAFAHEPVRSVSGRDDIKLINVVAGMRVASVAESAANTVYSMGEIAAQLANRVSNGTLPTSFNRLQRAAATDANEHPWHFEDGLRGYRRVRELRVEWTHHSSTLVLERDGQTTLVVRGTRRRGDRIEFVEQILCTPGELADWCTQARELFDRFAVYLLTRHVLGLYDLNHEITDFVFDDAGLPALREGRPFTRKLSIRQYFHEGGIPV